MIKATPFTCSYASLEPRGQLGIGLWWHPFCGARRGGVVPGRRVRMGWLVIGLVVLIMLDVLWMDDDG